MNPGDVLVCGVSEDVLVEDIQFSIPRGHAIVVPGDKANKSKDLWRLISQGTVFKLQTNSLLHPSKTQKPSEAAEEEKNEALKTQIEDLASQVTGLRDELQRAKFKLSEQAALEAEVGRLQAENARLRADLATRDGLDSKLETILSAVKDRPATVVVQGSTQKTATPSDDAPIFIPSQIKGEGGESRVNVQETTSDGSGVAGASQALRGLKKRTQ